MQSHQTNAAKYPSLPGAEGAPVSTRAFFHARRPLKREMCRSRATTRMLLGDQSAGHRQSCRTVPQGLEGLVQSPATH